MQLYYLPGSPFARVVRILALELDAPCEPIVEMAFPPKAVEAVNPAMQVPVLVDGGRAMFGTRLIAEYLMTRFAAAPAREEPPLAAQPTRVADHWRDAQILVALETLLSALVARSYAIWTGVEHRSDAAIPLDLASREAERAYRLLDWLEREARPTGFIPGVFSLQDIWLVCTIAWTEARIAIDWRGRPHLEAIFDRNAGRQSVLRTIPSVWSPDR